MSQHTPQQRPTAARDAAPTPRATAGPAGTSLKTLSTALNSAPAVQRLATMAPNRTGLPDTLKAGVEAMSGMSLDHVRVHRNSAKPAQLNAHAYAQGSDIHLAPGQERHLPHEAWHVVQQAQGRVKPTMQMKGDVPVNDEAHLEKEADIMGARALAGVAQRAAVEEDEVHQMLSATTQRAATEDEEVHQAAGIAAQRKNIDDEDVHQMVRTPLQRVAATSQYRPVVQRAGVKSEMRAGEEIFDEFAQETTAIKTKRNQIATAIYDNYKPLSSGTQRNHYAQGGQHNGPNDQFTRNLALNRAKRLSHWTATAVNSAARIYEELISAMDYNDQSGIDYSAITFGKDTSVEPDVFPQNDTAMEVKRIDSASQGSVDGHITKVSQQLNLRKIGPQKTPIKKWLAKIAIANQENSWPYTPVSLAKASKSKTIDVFRVGEERILKYEDTGVNITYIIYSQNPKIGNFEIET